MASSAGVGSLRITLAAALRCGEGVSPTRGGDEAYARTDKSGLTPAAGGRLPLSEAERDNCSCLNACIAPKVSTGISSDICLGSLRYDDAL